MFHSTLLDELQIAVRAVILYRFRPKVGVTGASPGAAGPRLKEEEQL